MIKTHNTFLKEVFDLVGDEYTILSSYQKSNIKVKIRHNCSECNNHEYEVAPRRFKSGDRCPKCSGVAKKDITQFKQEVFDLVGDEYTVLSNYINTKTKIEIRHNLCNRSYLVTPKDFKKINGNRCPYCKSSRGELRIKEILEKYNLFIVTGKQIGRASCRERVLRLV